MTAKARIEIQVMMGCKCVQVDCEVLDRLKVAVRYTSGPASGLSTCPTDTVRGKVGIVASLFFSEPLGVTLCGYQCHSNQHDQEIIPSGFGVSSGSLCFAGI